MKMRHQLLSDWVAVMNAWKYFILKMHYTNCYNLNVYSRKGKIFLDWVDTSVVSL